MKAFTPTAPETLLPAPAEPVQVETPGSWPSPPPAAPNIAAIIVTWNRRDAVAHVLRALARQEFPGRALDVVVVDNGSTDGTVGHLAELFRPERTVENPTRAAHEPAFESGPAPGPPNRAGFRSLTLIRNHHNHGGCGGFNTGLAYVERFLDAPDSPARPAYVWLVDDDVDLPADALRRLVECAEADPQRGIVGSRTVDFDDRATTIETTIYFDPERGWMGPDAPPGHRMHDEHRRWAASVGGTRGNRPFTGVREVDVVSACSLLARWSAVKKVGFWDSRYFIYCDDADWCLRFGRAGYKVVCNLDAVVYHTYWLQKLTPARGYYSQRNFIWLLQKTVPAPRLRRVILRRLGALLVDSRKAATHCRLFHAEIIRRTADDVVRARAGRLDAEGPAPVPVLQALESAGALRPDAEVLVMCSHPSSIEWADDLRGAVTNALQDRGQLPDQPRWTYMVRDRGPVAARRRAVPGPPRIVFEPNRWSKLRVQWPLLLRRPTAVVLFDQSNEFPLLRSRCNIHIDRKRPLLAQVERDGLRPRLAFALRWSITAMRCAVYALRVRPHVPTGKYG